jgi:NADH:ubiquinone oxidoreductase subunit 6 (subunit J)
MLILLLVLLATAFAIGAIRARRLLTSAIWLAGVSALISVVFFLYGARQVAVIELSVGAGLVTVLFVFAISIAGDDVVDTRPVIPWPMFIGISLLFILLLGWFVLPASVNPFSATLSEGSLNDVLWR